MLTTEVRRIFTEEVSALVQEEVRLKGWVHCLPILGKTAFIILRDCTGEVQCVIASAALKAHQLKVEDVIEILGTLRSEPRARTGCEVEISEIDVLNRAGQNLPFQSAATVESVGLDTL
jgi:nondiscriminating aspartyl-tRNA synthetase